MNQYLPPFSPHHPHYRAPVFFGLLGVIEQTLGLSGIDPSIVRSMLIAFASLLTQGTADVLWPNGQRLPIGLPVLLVAPSGAGKSVIFTSLIEPIRRCLSEVLTDEDSPHRPAFFIEDATREAIIHHLRDWPLAGLFTDEAGLLKQLLHSAASTLAKLLDGADLNHARVSTGRIELRDYRFTMLLTEQPQIFAASKVLAGASTGGVGVINRFYVDQANGLPVGAPIHRVGLSEPVKSLYDQKVCELSRRSIDRTILLKKRPALPLSPEAAQFLIRTGDQARQRPLADPRYSGAAEYMNRHAERVLGLAGVLHAFEYGSDTEIQLATVQAADQVCEDSINAFVQMTYEPPKVTQAERDTQSLFFALQQTVTSTGKTAFPLPDLRRCAPNLGMTRARFDRAIVALAHQGLVSIFLDGRTDWLRVNPQYPGLFLGRNASF